MDILNIKLMYFVMQVWINKIFRKFNFVLIQGVSNMCFLQAHIFFTNRFLILKYRKTKILFILRQLQGVQLLLRDQRAIKARYSISMSGKKCVPPCRTGLATIQWAEQLDIWLGTLCQVLLDVGELGDPGDEAGQVAEAVQDRREHLA